MSTNPSEVFPARLKAARGKRALTQGDLARKTKLQPSAISHFETGSRKPSFDNLKRLADALEVTIDYLLGRVDEFKGVGPTTDRIHRHIEKLSESDRQIVEDILKSMNTRSRKEE